MEIPFGLVGLHLFVRYTKRHFPPVAAPALFGVDNPIFPVQILFFQGFHSDAPVRAVPGAFRGFDFWNS
jgi:hypothetical protein